MNKLLLLSALCLCLISHCVRAQYQTAPAYNNGYQQQRKMAPSPQAYGQQMTGSMESAGDYEQSSADEQTKQVAPIARPTMMKMAANNNYGQQSTGGYGQQQQQMGANYGAKQAAYEEPKHPPMPYEFGYNIDDGYDNSQYRKENSDGNSVTGSYGYRDSYGVFRYVDYVADENGFRATVKTNEPGTANESPADVDWQAEQPPAQTNPGSKSAGNYGAANSANSYGSRAGQSEAADMSRYGTNSMADKYAEMQAPSSGGYMNTGSEMSSQSQYGASQMGGQKYGGKKGAQMGGQKYGGMMGSMMMMGRQMGGYGGGQAMRKPAANSMMAAGQYGASSMGQQQQQQYAGSMGSMASAGRSSRYKSQGSSGRMSAMRGAYKMGGSAGDGMQQNYGMQQAGDMQQYGSQQMVESMGPAGTKGGSQTYAAAAMQDEAEDSALAQQYGAATMGTNEAPAQSQQQYGAMGADTSSYSSMRLQTDAPAKQSNGRGAMSYGSANMGNAPMKSANSGAMDYKRAATRNIAALVKRY